MREEKYRALLRQGEDIVCAVMKVAEVCPWG